jgi:hypothetical protein
MSKDTIIYERTEGIRTYRIVNGDTTYANVEELFSVHVYEYGARIFDATRFLSEAKAKEWIKEKINAMRTQRIRHKI